MAIFDLRTGRTSTRSEDSSGSLASRDWDAARASSSANGQAPIVGNDYYDWVIQSYPMRVYLPDLLANDSDPDGDAITFDHYGGNEDREFHGIHAVVSLTSGNTGYSDLYFEEGFVGQAYVAYFVVDSAGNRSKGYIYVDVAPAQPNRAPVANDDVASANAGQALAIPVLANDSDPDGDVLTVSVPAGMGPAHGTATINANGSISYTATAGYTGSDSFTYRITDPEGLNDTATVTISVQRPPNAANDTVTVDQAVATDIAVRANDSDPDGHTLTIISVSSPSHGTATITGNGTIRYTPAGSYLGPDSFTYTISDGHGGTDTATVNITVAEVDDPPVAADDVVTMNEDTFRDIAVKANDSDPDSATLTVTAVGQSAHGTAVINADGTIRYTPNANYNGPDSFTYTLSDGNSSDTATVSVTITPVNDAPVATDDVAVTDEDVGLAIAVRGNDSDVDGHLLSVTAVTQGTHGTVAINGDGTVQYTPHLDYFGTDSFTYTLSDGNGGTDTATVTLTINSVNDAPVAVPDTRLMNENGFADLNVTANDTDVDGGPLVVGAVGAAAHGTTAINANGTVRYTPDTDWFGVDSFNYTVSDGLGGFAQGTVTVTVNNIPEGKYDRALTSEDQAVTFQVVANDVDLDGDNLVISAVTQGARGTVSIGVGGTLGYTPQADFFGEDSFTYTISDGRGGIDIVPVAVVVEEVVLDGERLVNDPAAFGYQDETTMAALNDGTYVIVFHQYSGGEIMARRFDAGGMPIGQPFQVNTLMTHNQKDAAVAALADGGFVVVYESFVFDAGRTAVAGQRFDASGVKVGAEFLVGPSMTTSRTTAAVDSLADGGFVVSYSEGTALAVQRYNADGSADGARAIISTGYSYGSSVVAGLTGGGYVVTEQGYFDVGGVGYKVIGHVFDANGNRLAGPYSFSQTPTAQEPEKLTAIAALPDGGFIAVWEKNSAAPNSRDIVARRFHPDGTANGAEFVVNTVTAGQQRFPSVAVAPDGRFAIDWTSSTEGTDGHPDVYVQLFTADGTRLGAPFRVNETITGIQTTQGHNGSEMQNSPTLQFLADGTLAVTWFGSGNGDGGGVFTRRFAADALVAGTAGDDSLVAGKGHDVVQGLAGADTLAGLLGNDQLFGGDGDDLLIGGPGADSVDGGGGIDTASYASAPIGVTVSLAVAGAQDTIGAGADTLAAIENLIGSAWIDTLTGNGADNVFTGGGEGDTVDGGAGADRFVYLSVADSNASGMDRILAFQTGVDTIDLRAVGPTALGWTLITDAAGDYHLVTVATPGGEMKIRVHGAIAIGDFLLVNQVSGTAQADRLTGSAAADAMAGGLGDDVYVVNHVADTVTEQGGEGTDTVETDLGGRNDPNAVPYVLPPEVENLIGTLGSAQAFEDNALNNQITTTTGADFIFAMHGGDDTITTGAGNDFIFFGSAYTTDDTVAAGAGVDRLALFGDYILTFAVNSLDGVERLMLYGSTTVADYDYDITMSDGNVAAGAQLEIVALSLAAGETLTFDGSAETDGSFWVRSGAGNDVIIGGAGADRIVGGLGADRITGGAGADRIDVLLAAHSTSNGFDTLVGFDVAADRLNVAGTFAGWGANVSGALDNAGFDAALAALVDGALGGGEAVKVTVNGGDHAGKTLVVYDADGDGAYTAGADYVFAFEAPVQPIIEGSPIFI